LVNVFIMMVWVGCLIVHLWIKNVCEIWVSVSYICM
jgi:hypothetical protein